MYPAISSERSAARRAGKSAGWCARKSNCCDVSADDEGVGRVDPLKKGVLAVSNRVTVAIPVFNGLPHIRTAVDSVLQQTYSNLDVVVIDNQSTDGTWEVLQEIDDDRIRLVRNETNIGLEGNWNRALQEAKSSPYFKLVCGDDLIYPEAIAREVAALDEHPDVAMTACQRRIIDDSGKTLIAARGLVGLREVVDGRVAVRRSIALGTNIIGEPTSVLVRSSVLEETGPFDGTYQYCIDFDMWSRILQRGKLYAIREPLAAFRVGALSNSGAIARKQRAHHVGEFRKLAAVADLGVSPARLYLGITMASVVTFARRLFYKLTERRQLDNKSKVVA